jgi:peptidoglycan/xylan/chitin deacetylase (PgdA/CDA1 family)
MIKFIVRKIRCFLGNVLGYVLYISLGRKILLNAIGETKVLSIYFHNPSILVFDTIIKWLIKYDFNIVSLEEFHEFFDKGKCEGSKTVFISFDDAWSGNLKLIPTLEKYNIPITLFVSTKAIEDGQIWLNIVREQFSKIDGNIKAGVNVNDIKKISYSRSQELYNSAVKANSIEREIMTQTELIEFSKFASIGSHTVTHPILTNCSEEVIKVELEKSQIILSEWGLNTNKTFAYPNGSYNEKVIDVLKESKYEYAFTTEPRFVNLTENVSNYEIPRICIPDGFGKYENLARMSTAWKKIFKN